MNGIELRVRREALGLSQRELAERLGTGQGVVSSWESGSREPRDPVSVLGVLQDLADVYMELADRASDRIEGASAKRDSPSVRLVTYESDADYWAADADACERGIPASLHRAAIGAAVLDAEAEYDVHVEIVTGRVSVLR